MLPENVIMEIMGKKDFLELMKTIDKFSFRVRMSENDPDKRKENVKLCVKYTMKQVKECIIKGVILFVNYLDSLGDYSSTIKVRIDSLPDKLKNNMTLLKYVIEEMENNDIIINQTDTEIYLTFNEI